MARVEDILMDWIVVNGEGRKFDLGRLVVTPGLVEIMDRYGFDPMTLLKRHAAGDWGDLCDEDKEENEKALVNGYRLFSAYDVPLNGKTEKIWVVTEQDRSSTCILLPKEY